MLPIDAASKKSCTSIWVSIQSQSIQSTNCQVFIRLERLNNVSFPPCRLGEKLWESQVRAMGHAGWNYQAALTSLLISCERLEHALLLHVYLCHSMSRDVLHQDCWLLSLFVCLSVCLCSFFLSFFLYLFFSFLVAQCTSCGSAEISRVALYSQIPGCPRSHATGNSEWTMNTNFDLIFP